MSASPHPRRVRRASKITPRAASLPPNKEWPPNDVWSEFRATHSGTWVGWAKRFAPNGAPIVSTSLENDNAVDEKTSGATDTAQWQRTVANSKFAGAGGIKEIDTLAIDTKYVEVGAVSATAGGVVGGKKKKKEKKKKKKKKKKSKPEPSRRRYSRAARWERCASRWVTTSPARWCCRSVLQALP